VPAGAGRRPLVRFTQETVFRRSYNGEVAAGGNTVVWVYVILLLSPAILYGLALIVVAIYGERCPKCGQRGLTCVGFMKATVVIDGRRCPDSWGYYACEKCGAKLKHHRGEWGEVPDHERRWFEETGANRPG